MRIGGSAPTVASSRCAAPPLPSFLAPLRPFGSAPRPRTEDGGWFGKQTILFQLRDERSCRPVRNAAKSNWLRSSDSATRPSVGDIRNARPVSRAYGKNHYASNRATYVVRNNRRSRAYTLVLKE